MIAAYLRSLARPSRAPHRKLSVSCRGYGRNPVNVAEVEEHMRSRGFEIYDPAEHADQASDFAEAAAVVGPSGAALQNVIFCAPSATVVELFSDAHLFAYHATPAQAGQLRYGYVVGTSADTQRPIGASRADFVIDVEELAAALEWAAAGEPPG